MKAVPAGGRAPTILRSLPLLFLFAAHLHGQSGVAEGNLTISVNVDLVVLHATVRDKKGGFVSGLEETDFHVFEDRAPSSGKGLAVLGSFFGKLAAVSVWAPGGGGVKASAISTSSSVGF